MSKEGSHFSADWLTLREPVDHRSRAAELMAPLRRHLLARGRRPVSIVDLGAGAGSNQRYLSAHLGVPAHWTLLDQDVALLARAESSGWAGAALTTEAFDLSAPLAPVLKDADLVTASALLDLVSGDWIQSLCRACASAQAAVLMALTVDGRVAFGDEDPLDAQVMRWVGQDQRREKGLGVALGAGASGCLKHALNAQGYCVLEQASDWVLSAADAPLARALIEGWCEAARRQCPQESAAIMGWAARRSRAVADGGVSIRVGHVDVLGLLPYPEGGLDYARKFRS
ncbi:MAG TPA: hypothetical protein VF285_05705 [Castellaniella sp.]|uniref:hypothetical protein n=1 Tax=Castellaniella sp. TaxID=1955812 RepID=UPI002F21A9CE